MLGSTAPPSASRLQPIVASRPQEEFRTQALAMVRQVESKPTIEYNHLKPSSDFDVAALPTWHEFHEGLRDPAPVRWFQVPPPSLPCAGGTSSDLVQVRSVSNVVMEMGNPTNRNGCVTEYFPLDHAGLSTSALEHGLLGGG